MDWTQCGNISGQPLLQHFNLSFEQKKAYQVFLGNDLTPHQVPFFIYLWLSVIILPSLSFTLLSIMILSFYSFLICYRCPSVITFFRCFSFIVFVSLPFCYSHYSIVFLSLSFCHCPCEMVRPWLSLCQCPSVIQSLSFYYCPSAIVLLALFVGTYAIVLLSFALLSLFFSSSVVLKFGELSEGCLSIHLWPMTRLRTEPEPSNRKMTVNRELPWSLSQPIRFFIGGKGVHCLGQGWSSYDGVEHERKSVLLLLPLL